MDVLRLDVEALTFGYARGGPILRGVSLSLEGSGVFALLGPNGAGKSTLLRCLARDLSPAEGRIRLDGRDIRGLSRRAFAREVAYIPQSHHPQFAFSVLDVVLMGRTPHLPWYGAPGRRDRRLAEEALERLGAGSLRDRTYDGLSGGERQLVLFASALLQEARVLLLDEPTSHLDFGNRVRVGEILRRVGEEGHLVVLTTHDPDQALWIAREAALLREGALLARGRPEEVLTEEAIRRAFGVSVRLATLRTPEGPRAACVPLSSSREEGPRG